MFVRGQGLVDTVSETSSRVPALDAACWNAPSVQECPTLIRFDFLGQSFMQQCISLCNIPPPLGARGKLYWFISIDSQIGDGCTWAIIAVWTKIYFCQRGLQLLR